MHLRLRNSPAALMLALCACAGLFSCARFEGRLTTPLDQVRPLTHRSSAGDILERMQQSSMLWESLQAAFYRIDYGPASYTGPERRYEHQLWIQQPGQSLVATGAPGEKPASAELVSLGTRTSASQANGETQSSGWNGPLETLVSQPELQAMLFPNQGVWAQQPGRLEVRDEGNIAGRKAVIADWFNAQEQWQWRLWIDALSGQVLRLQEYSGDAGQILLSDTQATSILYDQPVDSNVFNVNGLWSAPFTSQMLQATQTPAVPPSARQRIELGAAPLAFDPSAARLHFQLAQGAEESAVKADAARAPFELIADGYYLGELDFGLPWGLHCARSPDGQRLAYNVASDGRAPADESLRWLNLANPGVQYEPLAGLAVSDFAFSPDGRWLAAFGRSAAGKASGLYLVDLGLGENLYLASLWQGRGLAFSPDGKQLALVGSESDQAGEQAMLFDLPTRQLIYASPLDASGALPADWPAQSWSAGFPAPIGGMEACALLD